MSGMPPEFVKLLISLSRLMPSEAAVVHASNEWKLARHHWIQSITAIGLNEKLVGDLYDHAEAAVDLRAQQRVQ